MLQFREAKKTGRMELSGQLMCVDRDLEGMFDNNFEKSGDFISNSEAAKQGPINSAEPANPIVTSLSS